MQWYEAQTQKRQMCAGSCNLRVQTGTEDLSPNFTIQLMKRKALKWWFSVLKVIHTKTFTGRLDKDLQL